MPSHPVDSFEEVLRLEEEDQIGAIATTLFVRDRTGLIIIDKDKDEWLVAARIGVRATEVTIGVKDYLVTTLGDGTIVVLEKK